MTVTLERANLAAMTDAELSQAFADDAIDLATLERECARRDKAAKIRAASRARHEPWEAAARANFAAAEEFCRGDDNMLNPRGKAAGADPWSLWHGSEERARQYASDDLTRFWDYHQPRPPGPGEYRAAERAAEAEAQARIGDHAQPRVGATALELAERAAMAPRQPGSIARMITALGHWTRAVDAQTEALSRQARALARVNGGNQR